MRVILAGGGTGGHLFPAVALAERLLAENEKAEALFVGTTRGIEAGVIPKLGFKLEFVDVKGFMGKGIIAKLGVIIMLGRSVRQGLAVLDRFKPDLVIGVGGYASAPMVIAAKLRRLPVVLHEQNAIPGLTNRLLGRWADRVCVSFEETLSAFANAELTGNPLRSGLDDCPEIENGRPCLLIFGGSRGARAINERMTAAIELLHEWQGQIDIIHQTGEEDVAWVSDRYRQAGWKDARVTSFIDDMASAYRQAHLVVCRAGATTVAELTACGRPAILIPFPHAAGDHQSANARALAVKGAALMLAEEEADADKLAALIANLITRPDELKSMARIAKSLGRRGVAEKIIATCHQVMDEKRAA
ncbi:MAG: undecaprenyldiphospho-muramoylpentapeptide beta-N-acetylglucosaminyltransferase [Desulfuromonas sp.]|nr:MAG: undecaprenyldiphospho-muramoylpentapeptide beta-N-acetylglucosaminyltransferase [Desulfuromonas sp.]